MPQYEEAKNPVKSARVAINIVETLKRLDGARLIEVAEELGIAKSSAHNYLSTLREDGYVVKDDQGLYQVGLRFLDVGTYARNSHQIYDIAKEEVDNLADETGELSNLLVEEQGRGIYLHRGRSDDAVNVDAQVGHRVYLHHTALGKAILAYKPRSEVEDILDFHGMPESTPNTITEREPLFEELDEIRAEGVAFDREERLKGLRCVATPVLNSQDEPMGAISVSGPVGRMQGSRFEEEIPEQLENAATVIELNTTYA